MAARPASPWHGVTAALATMHGKQRAIAPVLARFLGITTLVPDGIDTDSFGTFTREVPRTRSAVETARAKAKLALECCPSARLGIGSEGSFGPDPYFPFVAAGQELVVVLDRDSDLELMGSWLDRRSNFAAKTVSTPAEALSFAKQVRFPSHALIVMGSQAGQPDLGGPIKKAIREAGELSACVTAMLTRYPQAHVETDMRAHLNPTRMRAIRRATLALLRRYRSGCPACARPGYGVTDVTTGLRCSDCGAPTSRPAAKWWACKGCGEQRMEPIDGHADPRYCDFCNP